MSLSLSSISATSTILNGISSGSSVSGIAASLVQEALGIDTQTFVNPVTFFFKDLQAGNNLQLPVNPDSVTIKWDRLIETVNILNLGEVDFTTGVKLQEISFSSFFPTEYVPSYCQYANIPNPLDAHKMMTNWRSRADSTNATDVSLKDPIQLIVTGATDINMPVIISQYEASERGGEPGDIYFSVTLREWKEIAVRTQTEQKAAKRTDLKPKPKTATIKPSSGLNIEEELFKIAKMHYGSGQSWPAVMNANASQLQGNLTKAIKLVLP